MRRPTLRVVLLVAALLVGTTACTDGGTATEPPEPSGPTTTAGLAQDPDLVPLLLSSSDLPAGFVTAEDADDTITSFCAGEDATAGLQASARALVGYSREGGGASVIHLVFRFDDDDAALFVAQAEQILGRCSSVPDTTGLAFAYESLTPEVATALAGATATASRYGVSIGSGKLSIEVAAFHEGDLGVLVAVLGVDAARPDLDALAATAFRAAVARLP